MRTLIAIDGSAASDMVLTAVAPWLKQAGSEADLLMVLDEAEIHATSATPPSTVDTPSAASWGIEGVVTGAGARIEDMRHDVEDRTQALTRVEGDARDRLDGLAARHLVGINGVVHVVDGHHAADTIIAQAQALGADAIAMGTHGRTGLARVVLGSVAQEVLRRSPVPVFLVHTAK
jgi:nucleotide-binding universal stress UspA family protein